MLIVRWWMCCCWCGKRILEGVRRTFMYRSKTIFMWPMEQTITRLCLSNLWKPRYVVLPHLPCIQRGRLYVDRAFTEPRCTINVTMHTTLWKGKMNCVETLTLTFSFHIIFALFHQKCHRSGQRVYAADNPIRISGLIFHPVSLAALAAGWEAATSAGVNLLIRTI